MTDVNKDAGEALHGWIVTYNALKGCWQGVKREDYFLLFNEGGDCNNEHIICAKSSSLLFDLIIKHNG